MLISLHKLVSCCNEEYLSFSDPCVENALLEVRQDLESRRLAYEEVIEALTQVVPIETAHELMMHMRSLKKN